MIYGDSITPGRAAMIIDGLAKQKIAANCVVFGVGSYTYQMVTRDSLGLAVKATYGVVDGKPRHIFKAPKTDDGTKNSLRGRVSVRRDQNGRLYAIDGLERDDQESLLEIVFEDGRVYREENFLEIRERAIASMRAEKWL